MKYNDGLCPGGRRPRLYLAKGGQVMKFVGENIPGFCAIAAQEYAKNGKWSNVVFDLTLAPGVRGLEFLSPMHGCWGDDLSSWGEVMERLALPLEAAQQIVRAEYPRTAERLDNAEAFAAQCEAAGTDAVELILAGGSPNNRAIAAGYWTAPLAVRLPDGTEVTLSASDRRESAEKWTSSDPRVRVIGNDTRPGMHGGSFALRCMAPDGAVRV